MKLLDRIKRSIAFGRGFVSGMSTISDKMNVTGMDTPGKSLLWIYLGMKSRADSVAQVPLRISDANDNIIESGPLYDLLEHPNSFMDRVQYMALIESYLALNDECQIAVVPSEYSSQPLELIPLDPRNTHPDVVKHKVTGTRHPLGWRYKDPQSGSEVLFGPDEIISIISYSPYNTTRALSINDPGRRAMLVDILSQEQNLAIFKNGGMPDVVFETDQRWDEEKGKEFLERWHDKYGGGAINKHKAGILTGGLKAKAIGLNPSELQFAEGRRMSRQEQIALMRVKPAMVGLMEGETGLSQGSSTTEQKAAWWSETGLFELARIASAHQRFLVNRNEWSFGKARPMSREEKITRARAVSRLPVSTSTKVGLTVWFDEYEIEELMEQRLKKVSIFKDLRAEGYKPDDLNEYLKLRLPPHTNNQAVMPFNLQPVEDVGAKDSDVKPAERQRKALDLGKFDRLENMMTSLLREEGVSASNPKKHMKLVRTFDRFVSQREDAAASRWSRYFDEQRKRVLQRMRTAVKRADNDPAPQMSGDELLPEKEERKELTLRITPLLEQHLRDGIDFFREETGEDKEKFKSLTVDDPRFFKALEEREVQAANVNQTTRDKLKKVLEEGYDEGDTISQLTERINKFYRETMTGDKKPRPRAAAETQTAGIVNDGRMLAAREVGGLEKFWLISERKTHRDAHVTAMQIYTKEPIGLDQKFKVNGYLCDSPGSTELPAGEVVHCGCMLGFRKAGAKE